MTTPELNLCSNAAPTSCSPTLSSPASPPSFTNPLPTPESDTLLSERLIRNASAVAAEDAGKVLSLALQQLVDSQQYLEKEINRLQKLIDGLAVAEQKRLIPVRDQLWDAVTAERSVVTNARRQLRDADVVLRLALNLSTAAAEIAYNSGSELAAAALNDKINRAELYKKTSEEPITLSEQRLALAEVQLVASTPTDDVNNNEDGAENNVASSSTIPVEEAVEDE